MGIKQNRGSKYILDVKFNNPDKKLICVVCHHIKHKSTKNKVYKLFDIGFNNNTLCYINNLEKIIKDFFELK